MIKVASYLSDCPRVWQNYIKSVNPNGELNNYEVDEITKREWNGISTGGKSGNVVFMTPEDEMFFILRWS